MESAVVPVDIFSRFGIVLAAVSSTPAKGGMVQDMGSMAQCKVIIPGMLATLATAIGVVFLLQSGIPGVPVTSCK